MIAKPVPEGGRLAEGMLVEASILAKLLGVKLLTVDASILLLPASAASTPRAAPARGQVRGSRSLTASTHSPGSRLGLAVRSMGEGSELLAQARRNRSLLNGRVDG